MNLTRELWLLFPAQAKCQLIWLFVAMLITAAFEVVGVASIMPFMMAIKNPELLQQSEVLVRVGEISGLSEHISLVTLAGVCTLALLIFTNISWLASSWLMLRLAYGQVQKTSSRLLQHYLGQPYEFFIERNSSDLSKNVLSEVNRLTTSVVIPILQLTAKSLVVCCLTGLLLYINTKLTLMVILTIGGAYASLYLALRKRLMAYGKSIATAETQRFQATGEAFGGIKELKLLRREMYFEKRFSEAAARHANIHTAAESLAILPRYLLEMAAFGGMIALALYLMASQGQTSTTLPMLALYAFVGYRAMPAIQQIYYCLVKIRYNRAVLTTIVSELNLTVSERKALAISQSQPRLQLKKNLALRDICYRYPSSREILNGVSLSVKANTTCGFAGSSGAGKTTLIDVILGLLTPSAGILEVDGEPVNQENLAAWQACIGYVPQTIYLVDDTIAGNIAFGVPVQERHQEQIEIAAKRAHLHEFILSLPEGYQSIVGERGVKLSGGQRQRIGIARALYREPRVLILDEATSALDTTTESAVMDAIAEMSGKMTILIIAHRLSTLRQCDQILLIDAGRIVDAGNYQDLSQRNAQFRSYVAAHEERVKKPEEVS